VTRQHPLDDEGFARAAGHALDGLTEGLDGPARLKLDAARRRALAGEPVVESPRASGPWWLPAGAMVTVSMALMALVMWWPTLESPQTPTELMADMELLAAAEEVSFYQDLDFYLWLAEQDHAG